MRTNQPADEKWHTHLHTFSGKTLITLNQWLVETDI